PSVRSVKTQTLSEVPREPNASGVIVCVEPVCDHLDGGEIAKRRSRGEGAGGSGNCLVDVLEAVKMVAFGSQISEFDYPVVPQLPLDVQQILHGVGSSVIVGSGKAEGGRYLGDASTTSRNRIRPRQSWSGRISPCLVDSCRDVAGHVEVHRIPDILHVEDSKAAADHSVFAQRIGYADARSKVFIFRLQQVVIQTAAADRRCDSPADIQTIVGIGAAAMSHEYRPVSLGNIRCKTRRR